MVRFKNIERNNLFMTSKIRVGIFGATGAVGKELLKVLFDRKFPMKELRLFASEKSVGSKVDTPLGKITIENANTIDYSQLDIAFFAIGGGWPKEMRLKQLKQDVLLLIIVLHLGMIKMCHWLFRR